MSSEQLYIPNTLRVGYQERSGTYTQKLAYVVYYDDKNKLRKETSWKNWIQHDLGDIENTPMEGFVLNKGVGGQRYSYGWNARNEYIRVYDPRGWEFEISVANLLFILQETSSIQGKGLEGEFVYSWDGKELVLLPTCSQEYKQSTEYTKLQAKKVSARDLQVGCAYLTKKQEELIYLGRFDFTEINADTDYDYDYRKGRYNYRYTYEMETKKQHIFYDAKNKGVRSSYYNTNREFFPLKSMTSLAMIKSEDQVSDYAEIMDRFNSTYHASAPVEIITEDVEIPFDKEKENDYRLDLGSYALPTAKGFEVIKLTEEFVLTGNWGDPDRKRVSEGYQAIKTSEFTIDNGKMKRISGGRYDDKTIGKQMTQKEVENMNLKKGKVILANGFKSNLEEFNV